MTFQIKNQDSLDHRDAKMPPELLKALYDLQVKSILDIGCGTGWLCDYMPPNTYYAGFDKNLQAIETAKKLHPEGRFFNFTIENVASMIGKKKYDCAFIKCIFCIVSKQLVPQIVDILKNHAKYVFLYDTETEPNFWAAPFLEAGFTLEFTHLRERSQVQIWRTNNGL